MTDIVEQLESLYGTHPICMEAAAEISRLRASLSECVEQNTNCLFNHYGENPEGCSIPEYITRARSLIRDRG